MPAREIVLDIETTGLSTQEGHRILEIAAVEMKGRRPTGREFYALVNPDRDIPAENSKIHGITEEKTASRPFFAEIARAVKDFIGEAPIVITCRTYNGTTLDIEFLNMEMQKAGLPAYAADRWVNVRRWSEAMFGNDGARLDAVLDRYKIDRSEREQNGHGALLDARLLAAVYQQLSNDYTKHVAAAGKSDSPLKHTPLHP